MRRPHVSVGKCPGLVTIGQVLGAGGVLCSVLLYVPLVIHFVGRQDVNQNSHYLGDRRADL